jgi:hypothetical protein
MLTVPADLSLKLFSDTWDAYPDRAELGEHVFLTAAGMNDTEVMMSSSRKMFNTQKTANWARMAAWAEWVAVSHQPPTGTLRRS